MYVGSIVVSEKMQLADLSNGAFVPDPNVRNEQCDRSKLESVSMIFVLRSPFDNTLNIKGISWCRLDSDGKPFAPRDETSAVRVSQADIFHDNRHKEVSRQFTYPKRYGHIDEHYCIW